MDTNSQIKFDAGMIDWPNSTASLLVACCIFFVPSVHAVDIDCESTDQAGERIICDYAILRSQYEKIFDRQQELLKDGDLIEKQLEDWRRQRNECIDVQCMDRVFAGWSDLVKGLRPNPASTNDEENHAVLIESNVSAKPRSDVPVENNAAHPAVELVLPTPVPEADTSPLLDKQNNGSEVVFGFLLLSAAIFVVYKVLRYFFSRVARPDPVVRRDKGQLSTGGEKRIKIVRSAGETLDRSFRRCVTCEHWGGARSPSVSRIGVDFQSDAEGMCYARQNPSARKPHQHCGQWRRWSLLKS